MLKHRIAGAAAIAALLLILVPVPSQAAPWTGIQLSGPSPGLLAKIGHWWTLLLSGPEPPPSHEQTAWQKNGVGMDPNGKPQPDPGGGQGPQGVTEPAGSTPN